MNRLTPGSDRHEVAAAQPRLTEAQRRHLIAMLGPNDDTLYWNPYGSEQRTAEALKRLGLLEGSAVSWSSAYYLSDAGLALARSLRAES